ncbi:MAG: pyridoxal-phosphate dependent enzyme [Planctomycetota bacterium]
MQTTKNERSERYAVSFQDVVAASQRIATVIHKTPVFTCESLDRLIGTRIFMKCENFQKTGAFKYRGASNAVMRMTPDQRIAGVVTHSSGNHAGAIAAASQRVGCTAHIVMPSNSTEVKKAAVRSYGGAITECLPTLADREKVSVEIQQATGATMIPPFNHPDIIAGQGTCALEFMKQVPYLDVMVSPIGGGGLMSGTCVAVDGVQPKLPIWGVEPTGAADAHESKLKGEWVPQTNPETICDGLRTSLGDLTWPFIRDRVDEILLADDKQTTRMMQFIWERSKLIIEPSCAVVLAALKEKIGSMDSPPAHVGVIIGGGNVDLTNLPWN